MCEYGVWPAGRRAGRDAAQREMLNRHSQQRESAGRGCARLALVCEDTDNVWLVSQPLDGVIGCRTGEGEVAFDTGGN